MTGIANVQREGYPKRLLQDHENRNMCGLEEQRGNEHIGGEHLPLRDVWIE